MGFGIWLSNFSMAFDPNSKFHLSTAMFAIKLVTKFGESQDLSPNLVTNLSPNSFLNAFGKLPDGV